MNLSVIISCWKLPAQRVYEACWQLSHQSEAPLEIIIVNASPDADSRYEVADICGKFPLVKCIDALQDVTIFNLSRSSNIGIRHTSDKAEYISVVALDILYARNAIEVMAEEAQPDRVLEAPLGNLPNTFDLKPIESLWNRWGEVLDSLYDNPPRYSFSPGAISCIRRDWAMEVRGYDEQHYTFSYGDSNFLNRAKLSGIEVKIVPWNKTQLIHIEHKARFPLQVPAPTWAERDIVLNGEQWGEIPGVAHAA